MARSVTRTISKEHKSCLDHWGWWPYWASSKQARSGGAWEKQTDRWVEIKREFPVSNLATFSEGGKNINVTILGGFLIMKVQTCTFTISADSRGQEQCTMKRWMILSDASLVSLAAPFHHLASFALLHSHPTSRPGSVELQGPATNQGVSLERRVKADC